MGFTVTVAAAAEPVADAAEPAAEPAIGSAEWFSAHFAPEYRKYSVTPYAWAPLLCVSDVVAKERFLAAIAAARGRPAALELLASQKYGKLVADAVAWLVSCGWAAEAQTVAADLGLVSLRDFGCPVVRAAALAGNGDLVWELLGEFEFDPERDAAARAELADFQRFVDKMRAERSASYYSAVGMRHFIPTKYSDELSDLRRRGFTLDGTLAAAAHAAAAECGASVPAIVHAVRGACEGGHIALFRELHARYPFAATRAATDGNLYAFRAAFGNGYGKLARHLVGTFGLPDYTDAAQAAMCRALALASADPEDLRWLAVTSKLYDAAEQSFDNAMLFGVFLWVGEEAARPLLEAVGEKLHRPQWNALAYPLKAITKGDQVEIFVSPYPDWGVNLWHGCSYDTDGTLDRDFDDYFDYNAAVYPDARTPAGVQLRDVDTTSKPESNSNRQLFRPMSAWMKLYTAALRVPKKRVRGVTR